MADLPYRKPNRLKGYKYNQNGAYFITICVQNRINLLGDAVGVGFSVPHKIRLTEQGKIAEQYVLKIPLIYPNAAVDRYVIMPNHVHILLSIIDLTDCQGSGTEDARAHDVTHTALSAGSIIGWYKHETTKEINSLMDNGIIKIWQRSFHDHIIRNENDYLKIMEYIDTNPQRWKDDCFFNDVIWDAASFLKQINKQD